LLTSPVSGQGEFWKEVNGPFSSYALSLAIAPNGVLFLGTPNGIYVSSNGGSQWNRFTNAPPGNVGRLLYSPDSTLYALSDNVYYSRDNGLTWASAGLNLDAKRCIAKAADGSLLVGVQDNGIFRSTNNGLSWKYVGLANTIVFSLAATKSGIVYAGSSDGLFLSTDYGASWTRIVPSTFYTPAYPIAIDPQGNVFVVALGVFRSSDGGQQWQKVLDLGASSFAFDSLGNSYLGAFNGIYKSTDRGVTWNESDTGVVKTEVTGLVCNKKNQIFASVYQEGVYCSTSSGASWNRVNNGLRDLSVTAILLPSDSGIITATNSGVFRSSDKGASWLQVIPSDYYGTFTTLAKNRDGFLFAGNWGQGLYSSSNSGVTWTRIPSRYYYVSSIASNNSGLVCVATWQYGVGTSSDNGKTWNHLGLDGVYVACAAVGPHGDIYLGTEDNGVYVIQSYGSLSQISPHFGYVISLGVNARGHLFAGTYGDGLFRSTDAGRHWVPLTRGLPAVYIYSISITPSNDIYVGTFYYGVFRSTDNGESWGLLSNELEGNEIYSSAMGSDGLLFIGTKTGLYQTQTASNRPLSQTPILNQNYPNPFNSRTTISFSLNEPSLVTITLYDILGRERGTLLSQTMTMGNHALLLNSSDLTSGVYFYRMRVGNFAETKKLVLIK
jgi:photosystem II stability/assembly factor-like uncharacterized protein